MLIWNIIVAFFNSCSRGELIGIVAIFVAIILFIANIYFERRKKQQVIIDIFIEPLLRLKTIIETKSIPDRASYGEFINQFAIQENSMSIIRNRMNSGTKSTFDKKWAEYKEEREGYKNYWDTNLKGKFSVHKSSKRLIVLIDELINLASKI